MSESNELFPSVGEQENYQDFDPELNIRSELFNPLKALLSPETPIPVENAPQYNNVAHYESALKRQSTQKPVNFFSFIHSKFNKRTITK